MKRTILVLAICAAAAVTACAAEKKILVYTRNYTPDGKGYVHDNVAASVAAIQKMGAESGFKVDVSAGPEVFTTANLKQYRAIVFSNTNNEAFATDAQRAAFTQYLRSGRGFVGIHSATGSERKWPEYWKILGGKFLRHPKFQPFPLVAKDAKFPAMKDVPGTFTWSDECYYHDNLNPDIKIVMTTDPKAVQDPKFAADPGGLVDGLRPMAWYRYEGKGRVFYTALGHKKEDYANPILVKHILGGIQWAMGSVKYGSGK